MTTTPNQGLIPEVTLGWRLRMAREMTGMGLVEFAEHIGVSADTCTSAEHDRRKVRSITINAYAMASGVDREWLRTGVRSDSGPTPPDDGERLRKLTEAKRSRGATRRTPNTAGYAISTMAA